MRQKLPGQLRESLCLMEIMGGIERGICRKPKSFSEKLQARDGIGKTKIGDRKTRGYRGIRVIKAVEPTRSYQDD